MIHRRQFLQCALPVSAAAADAPPSWGGPVLDIHHHLRRPQDGDLVHMRGSGVTHAVLLTRVNDDDDAKARMAKHAGKFIRFASADVSKPESFDALIKALKNGAVGMGELKSHVAADGPQMSRIYDIAAEMRVPVLMHFQEVEQFAGEGTFNTGLKQFAKVLKAHPKTTFIAHADFFWANVSADVPMDTPYPKGPIKKGGVSDKLLGDFANFYGDMSANSGRNALGRDSEFMAGFLARHQNKLMFGSDCSCTDGRGAGQRSTQPLIASKCVARETLTAIKQLTKPEVFRKLTWENGSKLLGGGALKA